MHELGFNTWYGWVSHLSNVYNIDLDSMTLTPNNKMLIKTKIKNHFIGRWKNEINDNQNHPKLRLYSKIKTNFSLEPYLSVPVKSKFRYALSKIRTSSHPLEIERGRHTNPVTPVSDRTCHTCNIVEDEIHFLTNCSNYGKQRIHLYSKIQTKCPEFSTFNNEDKFVYMLRLLDPQILS